MASTSRTLTASKFGWVDSSMPNTVFSVGSDWMKIDGSGKFFYFATASFPSSLKRRKLYGFEFTVPFKNDFYYENSIQARSCDNDFSPSTLTYNNRPSMVSNMGGGSISANSSGDVTVSYPTGAGEATRDFLQHCVCRLSRSTYTDYDLETFTKKTPIGGGNIAVKIYYDDSAIVETKPIITHLQTASPMDPRQAHAVMWVLTKANDSEYCVDENFVQASAKFQWRVGNSGSWNEISISGTAGVSSAWYIPANTFPSGSTIQCRVVTTDTAGSVGTSETKTVTTITSQITPYSYPTGTAVDNRVTQKFAWTFEVAGGTAYAQQSAALKWHVEGASTWNTINASGSTRSVTVPAYTFPANSTIVWWLTGTDAGGHTSTTQNNQKSFKTLGYTLNVTNYPSGSGVTTKNAVPFTWTLANSQGAVTQQSATLYWRVSGASTWNTITNSTSTKSISVPAYTWPTASTIQWYLTVTAADGTVLAKNSAQSPGSFTTATPNIRATNYPTGSNVDTRSAITFSWEFQSAAGNYPQQSATFYWRVGSSGSFTSVAASGATTSVTIPANTFPTASTIQWYVKGTDASGRTTYTSTSPNYASFTTVTPKVTAKTFPSGSDVYPGAALKFTWEIESAVGNYAQRSARLGWRTNTSNPYTYISASGATKSLSVPANTFPTNATVYWILEATDVGGHTSTTTATSFKTLTSQITVQNSPTSGYSDPRYAIPFNWYFSTAGGTVPQGAATFYWKVSTSETYTSVAASGSTTKVTIAANTFPVASTINWYVSGTDYSGTASTSPVYSFSTAAWTAYAYPQSPIGTAEDGSKAITFRWSLVNADGTQPAKVTLSWKRTTDVSWTVLKQSTTPFSTFSAPAGTFPTGEIEWKVVATNRDNVDGPAGTAAFVCLRAPDAPNGLRATSVPITTISWQSNGQEAYELYIDGEVVQKAFGPEITSWTVPQPLEDGIHTVTVRIQGAYGLWSEPSSATVDIVNTIPEGWEDFTLSGQFEIDVVLTASGADEAELPVQWYRDGKRIARTAGRRHTDRYVLGKHSYYAEIWNSDGNYVRTETVEGSMKSCITRIAPYEGGEWLDLRLSENSDSVQSFRYQRTNTLRHVLGTKLPVLELAEFEDGSGSYNCAFKDVESAQQFERMFGEIVILKSRGGNVVIGALTDLEKRNTDFYISYGFSVQRIAREDFVDG